MRKSLDRTSTAEVFDGLRADYNAAKRSRYRRTPRGVAPSGSGADYHYRQPIDYWRMLELAREFFRNNSIVAQGVRRLVDNCIQDGFALDPQTGNADADQVLSQRWNGWSKTAEQCEASGRFTFHELERLVMQQVLVDGDLLGLMLKTGRLEMVEAHRLRSPQKAKADRAGNRALVLGVLIDGNRRPLEYWLSKKDVDPSAPLKVADVQKYPARDADGRRQVLHFFLSDRVSQTRGVTIFAPTVDTISMGDDLMFAMLVKAQHSSVYSIFHQIPESFEGSAPAQKGERETETYPDGYSRVIEGVAPGMEIFGRPGEQLQGFSPNIPNPEFFQHAKLLLTIISINLGMPLQVFLLDPEHTNFSGWRGAIDQARIGFRRLQRWLASAFHDPAYQWKVRQWIAEDRALAALLKDPGVDLYRHRFQPPSWAYIEPMKDAAGDLLRLRNALISGRRRAAERGLDYDELTTEIVEDNAQLIRKAHQQAGELNNKFPDLKITWRELASLPTPDGVNVTLPVTTAAGEEQNNDDN